MARRTLLNAQDRQDLFDIPIDEDSLIRHYSLSPADRLEIEVRRGEHNRLGFAVQLCLKSEPIRRHSIGMLAAKKHALWLFLYTIVAL
ncbi:DUF4158 domain-containing protein [Ensifer canadensis]